MSIENLLGMVSMVCSSISTYLGSGRLSKASNIKGTGSTKSTIYAQIVVMIFLLSSLCKGPWVACIQLLPCIKYQQVLDMLETFVKFAEIEVLSSSQYLGAPPTSIAVIPNRSVIQYCFVP